MEVSAFGTAKAKREEEHSCSNERRHPDAYQTNTRSG